MNAWFRRLLLILTIGGGAVGIVLTMSLFGQMTKVFGFIILLAFIALYGYGVFVGLKLSEGPVSLKHLRVYFGLQIPFFSSPIIGYRFCSGFQFTAAVMQPGFRWDLRLGSEWQFILGSPAPWGIGINFFALAILLLLHSRLAGPDNVPAELNA